MRHANNICMHKLNVLIKRNVISDDHINVFKRKIVLKINSNMTDTFVCFAAPFPPSLVPGIGIQTSPFRSLHKSVRHFCSHEGYKPASLQQLSPEQSAPCGRQARNRDLKWLPPSQFVPTHTDALVTHILGARHDTAGWPRLTLAGLVTHSYPTSGVDDRV